MGTRTGAGKRIRQPTLALLLRAVREYLPPADLTLIRRSHRFAADAHAGQIRRSGEAYIVHLLCTALTLADLRLDATAIAAGLLHDVPEDTAIPLTALREEFGGEVAKLVAGVSRLTRLARPANAKGRPTNKANDQEAEAWAVNLRKLFLAMAEDVRVVLIKLADRLHNMETLAAMPLISQKRIAQETLDIYAPLAGRLGILRLRRQLEDLAFERLKPEVHAEISGLLAAQHADREQVISAVILVLDTELAKAEIKAEFSGRLKHVYGIYRKMSQRGLGFSEVFDITAVRVIVASPADCYRTLGVVHALWPPIPGQFDDYIAMPKENRYQSLHTAVVGPEGKPMEIQIRTPEMHRLAEYGIAAHWRYKEGAKRDPKLEEAIAWLRQLVDWQKETGGAREFVESLKTDVFRDQVYVFTPKGEVVGLAAGATPIDFAYRIHTDIGHHCVGAIVNQRFVSLDYRLQNGDIVEITTAKTAGGPSRDWLSPNLNYVKTAQARARIRQWFRRQTREDNVARGREQLERERAKLGLNQVAWDQVASALKFESGDDLLAAVGCGELSALALAARLVPASAPPASVPDTDDKTTLTTVRVLVEGWDRPGLLRDVAGVVADHRISMSSVSVATHSDRTATIRATLVIRDLGDLTRIVAGLEGLPGVSNARRELG